MTDTGGLPPDITATPPIHVMNTETDLDSVALDPNPMTTAIGATAATTHIGANQGHFTGLPRCHFSCDRSSSSYCHHCDTPHHRHSNSRDTSQDDSRSCHRSEKHHYKPARGSSSSSRTAPWKSKERKHKQVTIDDPLSDYYNSDDNDSDSDDDLN